MRKKKKELTDKQRMFCEEYIKDFNATQAAIRAGYEANAAAGTASKLLINPNIQGYLAHCKEKRNKRTQVSADMVVQELLKIAMVNMDDFYDEDGELKPPAELSEAAKSALASYQVKRVKLGDDDYIDVPIHKTHDKMKALELLGKHVGAFEKDNAQKQPVNQNINISWE